MCDIYYFSFIYYLILNNWKITGFSLQKSYWKYGFVATGCFHTPSPFCIICGDRPANELMMPSKLLCHFILIGKNIILIENAYIFRKYILFCCIYPPHLNGRSVKMLSDIKPVCGADWGPLL